MIEELDRANELITEFLAIAQKRSYEIQTINLNDIIKKLFPLLQAEALMESKFIKMELDDIPKLPLNEAEIRQVIINLVKNAIDISPVNGFVKIKTEEPRRKKKVVLSVHDQGTGISQKIWPNWERPFLPLRKMVLV